MRFTLIASAFFAATAFAGFSTHKYQFQQVSNGPNGAKMMMARSSPQGKLKDCKDNIDCSGLCAKTPVTSNTLGIAAKMCAKEGTQDYCEQTTKKCYCVVQDPGKVCDCMFAGETLFGQPFPKLDDSCHRGDLVTGDNYCIYSCKEDGGNGSCDAEEDPCKAG